MAELFNIRLESDLSEFDSTVTDGGDLSQGTPGLADTVGRMECLIDDTNAMYGQADFSSSSGQIRIRFYIDISALTMGDGNMFTVLLTRTSGSTSIMAADITFNDPFFQIRAGLRRDAGSYGYTGEYTFSAVAEHYIEIHGVRASGDATSDASVQLWIDGVSQELRDDIDLYDNWTELGSVRLGPLFGIDAGTSGTLYLDEFTANDDGGLIGPYVNLVTVLTTYDGYSVPIGA